MRGFFKFVLGTGMLAMAASASPACSSDDSSAGSAGKGGTSGTGGTDGGVTCGSETCQGYSLSGVLKVPGCCSENTTCGLQLETATGQLIGLPAGCYEIGQEGTVDCGCPGKFFTNPIDQKPAQFNGCCSTAGKCGYWIDLTSVDGPKVGCQEATKAGGVDQACTPGSETAPPPDPEGGEGECPNPNADAGTGGSAGAGGAAGGGGTAGAAAGAAGTAGAAGSN
jgi:hypothetical protein